MITEKERERIGKELAEIQSRIPKALLRNVVKEKKYTPTLEKITELALNDPDFPEEKKKQLRILKETGEFSKVVPVENKRIAKMIDEFVSREIKKKIKKGLLPKKVDLNG